MTTRWYRSPELVLNLPYTVNIDVFAMGCILVELYLGYEAFPGRDAVDQLNKIFSVTGTPSYEEWPEGVKHLQEKKIVFPVYRKIDLKKHIRNICDGGVDVIMKMIECNQTKRISAEEVFKHEYFKDLKREALPLAVQTYLARRTPSPLSTPIKTQISVSKQNAK